MNKLLSYIYDVRKIPGGESLEQISEFVKRNYPVLNKILKATPTFEMLHRAEKNASQGGVGYACRQALNEVGMNYEIRGEENIPETGSGVCPVNHYSGILEGIVLGATLFETFEKMKRQFRILVAPQLEIIKGIEKLVNFVDTSVKGDYFRSLSGPIDYIRNGGVLALCPAGVVSGAGLREYKWKSGLAYLAGESDFVLPMWISGPDHGKIYNLLAGVKSTERLRNVLMMRETWNKKGKKLILNIGKPISRKVMQEIGNYRRVTDYIRGKCEELKLAV